jgi:hypothetical protein
MPWDVSGRLQNITHIIDQHGDYVLDLKGNQELLHEAIQDYFQTAMDADFHQLTVPRTLVKTWIKDIVDWILANTGLLKISAPHPIQSNGKDFVALEWCNASA